MKKKENPARTRKTKEEQALESDEQYAKFYGYGKKNNDARMLAMACAWCCNDR